MSGKNIIFDGKKISNINFCKNEKPFIKDENDADEVLASKKVPDGRKSAFKHFMRYNNNDVIRPPCIKLPQMIGYVKCFDSNKTMSFKAINNRLLKKYTKIRKIVSSLINIKLDNEPVYGDNDKYIKTKIKSYEAN